MIQEAFLHFVWKNQYFTKLDLVTHSGETIEVQKIGFHNNLAGPDFKEAQIIIDGIKWVGAVEIHIKSSDWYRHQHEGDPNYDLFKFANKVSAISCFPDYVFPENQEEHTGGSAFYMG